MDDRYSRQTRFTPIGSGGQQRLEQATVAVLGCGALGSVCAEMLVRAGVGTVRLIDRDFVEYSNLQRQSLYTEDDAARCHPKATAAARQLAHYNSGIKIEPHIADCNAQTIDALLTGVDLVCDGCDNFQTRHLLNDWCNSTKTPWIYAACVGSFACCLPMLPEQTPCLACLQDELPGPGDNPTCDSSGIIAPAVHQAALWQVSWALKFFTTGTMEPLYSSADIWEHSISQHNMSKWMNPDCLSCGTAATRPYLQHTAHDNIVLCGRGGLQLQRHKIAHLDALTQQLGTHVVTSNEYLVRWSDNNLTATCFRDGRVIIQGTQDEIQARAFCDKWLG